MCIILWFQCRWLLEWWLKLGHTPPSLVVCFYEPDICLPREVLDLHFRRDFKSVLFDRLRVKMELMAGRRELRFGMELKVRGDLVSEKCQGGDMWRGDRYHFHQSWTRHLLQGWPALYHQRTRSVLLLIQMLTSWSRGLKKWPWYDTETLSGGFP